LLRRREEELWFRLRSSFREVDTAALQFSQSGDAIIPHGCNEVIFDVWRAQQILLCLPDLYKSLLHYIFSTMLILHIAEGVSTKLAVFCSKKLLE